MRPSRTAARLLLVAVVLAVAVLGYGHWFAATHGTLHVWAADATDPRRGSVVPLTLTFFDDAGRELARAASLPPWNPIVITSPARYACHEVERDAATSVDARRVWQECFGRQSRWLTTWIGRANTLTLETTGCRLDHIPVVVDTYSDAWGLWWLPLPHSGGRPYTSFTVQLRIDVGACRIVTR